MIENMGFPIGFLIGYGIIRLIEKIKYQKALKNTKQIKSSDYRGISNGFTINSNQ